MRELIQQIFKAYGFGEKWQDDSIEFYAAESEDKTSFFLIDYIEATGEGITDVEMLTMLKQLEKDYIDENTNGKDVKRKIQELFVNDNASIAAQIDKNTSAIYPIKLESLNNLDKYRNLIYSVEESPHYFRRFVLPYTDKQVDELKIIISDYPEKNIVNILSEIANQEEAYYELAGHRNLDNAYELVIRLFSKIPFLQYNFVAQQKPMAVEKRIESEMDASFSNTFFCRSVFPFSIASLNLVILLEKTNSIASKNVVFPNPFGPVRIIGFFVSSKTNS